MDFEEEKPNKQFPRYKLANKQFPKQKADSSKAPATSKKAKLDNEKKRKDKKITDMASAFGFEEEDE